MQQLARQLPQHSSQPLSTTRTFVSVKSPRVYPKKPVPRVYSERKAYLYNQYTRILETSSQCPLIFLRHDKFSISRLTKLRKDIAAATIRKGGFASSLLNPGPTHLAPHTDQTVDTPPSLTIIRTSIFGAALRAYAPLDAQIIEEIANTVEGGLAILSLPTLDPPQLNAILRALHRSAPFPRPLSTNDKPANDINDSDFVPGRRSKRVKPVLTPELSVMGALIEGRVFKAPEVDHVASLPTLDALQRQILGLLSSPAAQLVAVLNHAHGGQLIRTLEGFKKGLEERDKVDGQGSS